jgi:hypothetical protein
VFDAPKMGSTSTVLLNSLTRGANAQNKANQRNIELMGSYMLDSNLGDIDEICNQLEKQLNKAQQNLFENRKI